MWQEELIYGIAELKKLVRKRDLEEKRLSKYINPNKSIIKGIVVICIFLYPVTITLNHEYRGITSVVNFATNKGVNGYRLISDANILLILWTLIAIVLLLYQGLKSTIFKNKIYYIKKSTNEVVDRICELSKEYGIPMTYMKEGALEYFERCLKENRADNIRGCMNYYINETYVDDIIHAIKEGK